MHRLSQDISPFPTVHMVPPLHLGITTRVMAMKQAKQLKLEGKEDLIGETRRVSIVPNETNLSQERRLSRFLSGASIPNSVIRASINLEEPPVKDKDTLRRERDEFVEKVLKRLQPVELNYDETMDEEALKKIKHELKKESFIYALEHKTGDKSGDLPSAMESAPKDSWEELKYKRRISRRTSILAPLEGERRSTYESIRRAIQSSILNQQLINADNIRQQEARQIQTDSVILNGRGNELSSEFKSVKKQQSRPSRERRSSTNLKKKHSIKSARGSGQFTKPYMKSRNSNISTDSHFKANSKRVDLQTQTSFVIDNMKFKRPSGFRKQLVY